MSRDYCELFARIEEEPKKIINDLTIREFLEAREHLYNCDVCFNRSERILKSNKSNNTNIGFMNSN